jgi:uncharacterized protein YjaG (DUF416 family)
VSGERVKLEDVEKLLREVYERVELVRVRVGVLVRDMSEALERLEEGLKHRDERVVSGAVDELKTLVKYLDNTLHGHVLKAVVKVSEAGLRVAELLEERAGGEEKEP